jgi:hypothetical protein
MVLGVGQSMSVANEQVPLVVTVALSSNAEGPALIFAGRLCPVRRDRAQCDPVAARADLAEMYRKGDMEGFRRAALCTTGCRLRALDTSVTLAYCVAGH